MSVTSQLIITKDYSEQAEKWLANGHRDLSGSSCR